MWLIMTILTARQGLYHFNRSYQLIAYKRKIITILTHDFSLEDDHCMGTCNMAA